MIGVLSYFMFAQSGRLTSSDKMIGSLVWIFSPIIFTITVLVVIIQKVYRFIKVLYTLVFKG